jgi:hypothetical protein
LQLLFSLQNYKGAKDIKDLYGSKGWA